MTDKRTEKLRELFRTSPVMASPLPIKFETVSWHTITVGCERCKQDIPREMFRGTVSSLIPSVVTLEGVALCKKCLLLHHVLYRFRSDGSIEYVKDGQWVRNYGKKSTCITRMLERIINIRRKVRI